METAFTPWQSLAGGALIGLAAVALMAGLGRILGATGIVAGALTDGAPGERAWRLALLAGMVTGAAALGLAVDGLPRIDVPVSTASLIIGGLLVGAGASYGSGCTSGHGVCGLARLSPRSIVATATFMASAGATVFVLRHLAGG